MKNKGLEQYIDRNIIKKLIDIIARDEAHARGIKESDKAAIEEFEQDFGGYIQELQYSTAHDAAARYTRSSHVNGLVDEYAESYSKWMKNIDTVPGLVE